jgi:anti-sigma-K factor RskA
MPEIGSSDAGQAFLYVSGEMDAAEAAAFERRLGEEQALREALCQAVELMQTLQGLSPPAPRPAYRRHVRQRLLPRRAWWRGLTQQRTYRGHPALWSLAGAAAALLAILALPPNLLPLVHRTAPAPVPLAVQPAPAEPVIPSEAPARPATIEMAEMWASMQNHDHLARAHDEESRRRLRLSGSFSVRHREESP